MHASFFRFVFVISLLLSASFPLPVQAQEQSVKIDFSKQPDRSVKTVTSSTNEMTMFIEGNDELVEKNKKRGITNPFTFTQSSTNKMTTVTGKKTEDGSFPLQITLDEVHSYTENQSGNRIKMPAPMEKLVGLRMQGHITPDGKLKILAIEGQTLDKAVRDMLTKAFSGADLSEHVPDHPIKVGDSFKTEMPLSLAMPNQWGQTRLIWHLETGTKGV